MKDADLPLDAVMPEAEKYPFGLPQYTPKEMVKLCEQNRLKVNEVIYYHCHPFAPYYQNVMPQLFNQLGLLMQPLGYTPIGSLICSAFIAKISA